jgi:hypothetical protein
MAASVFRLKKHCAEEYKVGDFTIIMFYVGHC